MDIRLVRVLDSLLKPCGKILIQRLGRNARR
jgi:hypothetical protein